MKIKSGYKNIRLKQYDYHNGWFFVTNKTDFSHKYLVDNIYEIVKQTLIQLAEQHEGVNIDYFEIVPNHIHVILIFENSQITLSEFWRRFKALTTIEAKRSGFTGKSLWQRNYFEHIIRNELALQKIREYIKNNPLKEDLPLNEIYD